MDRKMSCSLPPSSPEAPPRRNQPLLAVGEGRRYSAGMALSSGYYPSPHFYRSVIYLKARGKAHS